MLQFYCLAEIMDRTPGNDVLRGSKVSITAVNGYETQLDDFIYGDKTRLKHPTIINVNQWLQFRKPLNTKIAGQTKLKLKHML